VQNQLILKGWELSEIKKAQLNDQNLGFIHLCIEKGSDKSEWNQVSGENTIVKTLWNQYEGVPPLHIFPVVLYF
jgi:hypothetical protein